MATTKGWPEKIKVVQPDRSRIEESMKVYIRVVRDERPPTQREEFALPESERLKTIN